MTASSSVGTKQLETTKVEWAAKIAELRKNLRLSQSHFGTRFGVTQATVSRWEAGLEEPSAQYYVQFGNLSPAPECWYFWHRAGLDTAHLERVLPAAETRTPSHWYPKIEVAPASEKLRDKKGLRKLPRMVALPLLKDAAAAGTPLLIDEQQIEELLMAPRHWIPHPAYTTCIRIKGDSMEPKFSGGDIVCVDASETERSKLVGKIIVAVHRDHGVTVKYLYRYGQTEMLVSENKSYEPIPISGDPEWRIIGKVLHAIVRQR